MEYKVVTLKEDKNLSAKHWEIVQRIWPPIMLHSGTAKKYWADLEKYFPEYQLYLVNEKGEVIGFVNTIPFYWGRGLNRLPDTGWDWLIQTGVTGPEKNVKANCLGGLQIGIDTGFQGKGFSKKILNELKIFFKGLPFRYLLIPLRPVLKHRYPLIPMKKYLHWKVQDRIFDPWLRTHVSSGAKIIKICRKSMTYTGSVAEWEQWSGRAILQSGRYVFDGILRPVYINIKRNSGIYHDENIWICYE